MTAQMPIDTCAICQIFLVFLYKSWFFWHKIQSAISLSSDLSKFGSISISYYSHLWLVIISLINKCWHYNGKNKRSKFLMTIFEINTTIYNIFQDHAQHYRPLENKKVRKFCLSICLSNSPVHLLVYGKEWQPKLTRHCFVLYPSNTAKTLISINVLTFLFFFVKILNYKKFAKRTFFFMIEEGQFYL